MKRIIAYCGLVCDECPAYLATQADDDEMRSNIAAEWSESYGCALTKEDINCDGCLGTKGRIVGYCNECSIRLCAAERGMENCAHCSSYACDNLERFLKGAPAAKALLDSLRDAASK
ncbi:MAG: DUF3795 domain-containing protein [Firmicutes bacterium]|jgi:predicted nucleic acid binding AN1-type Zn finger protein|nr:DUF3795 domain-containing protein [Bacillota bacterium]